MKYFYRDNCPHCDQVVLPEGLGIVKYNADEIPFAPDNVPLLQINGLNIVGDDPINRILKAFEDVRRKS